MEANQALNFVDDLKQYVEQDLNNLLNNAANLSTTPRFKELVKNNPEFEFAFEALELIPKISKIENPIDYFDILENSRTLQAWASNEKKKHQYNIANSIKLASLLAHSLTVVDNGKIKFVSTEFMANYGSETDFYLSYIGFLHQQNNKYFDIAFKPDEKNRRIQFKF